MTLRLRSIGLPVVALVAVAALAPRAAAQTNGTWIGTATTGNWSTGTNWLGGTIPDGGGIATFNNLTGQVSGFTATIDTTRTLSQIVYDGGYSFGIATGAGINLNMSATGLTLNSINSLRSSPSTFFTTTNTLSAAIAGTGNLVKTGAGNVALTGANTFVGTVQVNQGALWLNAGDAALGAAANGVEFNGGIIGINTTGGFTSNRTFTVNAGGGTFQTFTALTLGASSTLTGSGTLVKQIGNANLIIGGTASGFTGVLQIEGGGVTLQGAAALGGTANVDLAGTLTLDNTATNTSNRLNGRNVVARGGTFILNGNAAAATSESIGTMTLTQGNQFITLSPNAAQATTLTLAGLTRQNNSTLFVRGTNLGAAPAAGVGNLVITQDLSGQLVGGGGDPNTSTTASILPYAYGNTSATLTNGSSFVTQIAGGRIVPLSITSGYATNVTTAAPLDNVDQSLSGAIIGSPVTINSLRLAPASAIVISGAGLLTITSGAILNTSTATTAPVVTISAPITAGSRELVVTSTNGSAGSTGLFLNGVISGTGGLTRTGGGAVAFGGANTYTGTTTLASGTTTVGTTTLTADGSAPSAFGQDTSAINFLGSGSATRLWATGNLIVNRNLNVVLGGSSITGLGTAGLTAGESVVVNGNVTLTNTTGSLTNGFFYLEGGIARTQAVAINGNISGSGGLRANFGGYQILNGNNTYSGGTIIGVTGNQTGTGTTAQELPETWEVGSNSALGSGTVFWQAVTPVASATVQPIPGVGTLVAGGGARTLSNNFVLVNGLATVGGSNPLTLTGNVALNGSAANVSVVNIGATAPTTINGVVYDGGLIKSGAGTLTLGGANTYSGQTFVRAGTLSVGTIGNGGVAGNLGQAPSAAGYLTLTGVTINPSESGVLRYTGGGESTNRLFTLAGSGGTLDASGTGAINFTNTGSLTAAAPGGGFSGVTIQPGAAVIPVGTANAAQIVVGTVISNTNYAAGTSITEVGPNYFRTSTASTNPAAATGQTILFTLPAALTNRTFTLTGTNTGLNTLAPVVPNDATLPTKVVKSGVGTWQLTGANTYAGGTTVNGGRLVVNNSTGSGTGTGAVAVNAGGALAGGNTAATTGTISGAVAVNAGGKIAPGTPGVTNGIGTLTVANNVTVNGGSGTTWAVPLAAVAPNTPATAESGGANVSQLKLTGAGSILNLVASTANPITFSVSNPTGSTFTEFTPVSYVIGSVATSGNIQVNGGAFAFDPTAFVFSSGDIGITDYTLSVQSGTNLVLTFTPVPEPGSVLLVGAVATGLSWIIRRRRSRVAV